MAYTQQPQGNPGMQINHRNPRNLPSDSGGRDWSHGLCDCCGNGCCNCLIAWYCPCIIYGQNKKRLDYLVAHESSDPEHGGGCCSGDCALYGCLLCLVGFHWVLQCGTRGTVRSRYHIKGSGCGDCLISWCCTPCDLVQEQRELELEESSYHGKA